MDDPVIRLSRLDACAVSDAMDKLDLRGSVSGLARRAGSRRIAGRVMTFRLAEFDKAPPNHDGSVRHLGTTAIESALPGDIIVAEQRTGLDAACWGGILTLGAKLKGVAGVIAEGPVRDVDEAISYDFPLFSRATTVCTARSRLVEAETGGTITVGEIRVKAGDFVIGDLSGVVFVCASEIERVLNVAEKLVAREAAMAKALLAGSPITDVMGANYEFMLQHSQDNEEGEN